jgi:hypothetical protein
MMWVTSGHFHEIRGAYAVLLLFMVWQLKIRFDFSGDSENGGGSNGGGNNPENGGDSNGGGNDPGDDGDYNGDNDSVPPSSDNGNDPANDGGDDSSDGDGPNEGWNAFMNDSRQSLPPPQ